jgi:hypothetical protein
MGRVFSLIMGNHEIVKIELEGSYPYSDFMGWYENLDTYEKEVWVHIAKSSERTEQNTILLTKKAMELYCLEMGIDYIPNSEEYLEKIFRRLTANLTIVSLIERGLVGINSGTLSFIGDADLFITERGKKFMIKNP